MCYSDVSENNFRIMVFFWQKLCDTQKGVGAIKVRYLCVMYEANRNIKPKTSLIYCRVKKPEPGVLFIIKILVASEKKSLEKDDYRQI